EGSSLPILRKDHERLRQAALRPRQNCCAASGSRDGNDEARTGRTGTFSREKFEIAIGDGLDPGLGACLYKCSSRADTGWRGGRLRRHIATSNSWPSSCRGI